MRVMISLTHSSLAMSVCRCSGCLTDVPNVEEFSFTTDSNQTIPEEVKSMPFVKFDKHVDFSFQTVFERSQDDVTNYANDIISLGLFYSNYKDTVKEGDGDQVKTCWKYIYIYFFFKLAPH